LQLLITGVTQTVYSGGPYIISAVIASANGNLFITEGNPAGHVSMISTSGVRTELAGRGSAGYADGTGTNAMFNQPCGMCIPSSGVIYVADCLNHMIRSVTTSGIEICIKPLNLSKWAILILLFHGLTGVTALIAGSTTSGWVDGSATGQARFNGIRWLQLASSGVLYVSEYNGYVIRMISTAGAMLS
jgi:hypothetical protein